MFIHVSQKCTQKIKFSSFLMIDLMPYKEIQILPQVLTFLDMYPSLVEFNP